jgi:hypothetical protein
VELQLGNSKTGHSKEWFSEPGLSLKKHSYRLKTVRTYEWFSKPAIYSMIRLKIRNRSESVGELPLRRTTDAQKPKLVSNVLQDSSKPEQEEKGEQRRKKGNQQ